MRKLHYIFFVAILFACDSEDAWDCIQTNGKKTVYPVSIDEEFNGIVVLDDINVVFHNSDEARIELVTGENMVGDIEFRVDTSTLHVLNHNACKWTRKPNNVELHLYSSRFNRLDMRGYGSIITADSINYGIILRTYGPGKGDFTFNQGALSFQLYSLFNLNISGKITSLGGYVNDARDCIVDASQAEALNVGLYHKGPNDIIIAPINRLSYRITSVGNIILKRKPSEIIEVERTGSGQLIEKY